MASPEGAELTANGSRSEEEALINEQEADDLLQQLTLEEKVGLLSGVTMWESGGVPRLGLQNLRFSDGPHGARGYGLHGNNGAALAPCLSALAATFNEEVIQSVGEILGQECVARGANVLLGPTLNIHRTPITGRHFECFSEDPHLTSRAAVAYVRGVQKYSAACVKHLVGNDQEADRGHSNSVIPERVLHEVYLLPFEAAIREADAQAVMPGYNRLNGTYCAENAKLLQATLRDTWGFKGLVVSDWWANRTTLKALEAGLNVEMPGIEPRYFGGYLLDKAREGEVSQKLLDERCRPILRTLKRYPRPGRDSATSLAPTPTRRKTVFAQAAKESLVLLKNEGALPLRPAKLQRLALIGPAAAQTTIQGGGSSRVHPERSQNILQALKEALSGTAVELVHETGCFLGERPTKNPELEGLKRMGGCDAQGQPVAHHYEAKALDFILRVAASCSQKEFFRRCAMPCLRPLGLRHTNPDEFNLVALEFSNPAGEGPPQKRLVSWMKGFGLGTTAGVLGALCAFAAGATAPAMAAAVAAGSALGLVGAEASVQRSKQVQAREDASLERAATLCGECDATVLVLGTDGFWECEGVDQPHMRLPGRQDELLLRCSSAAQASGKPLILVLNVGSPKELPLLESVPAVLLSYYGGEQTAPAVAAALLGEISPAGRLPTTWPQSLGEASSEVLARRAVALGAVTNRGDVVYHEGLNLGYRGGSELPEPAFPFGHGLAYTTFQYKDFEVQMRSPDVRDDSEVADATLEVKNTGDFPSAEVVQVYSLAANVPRALRAFRRTPVLEPGASCKVSMPLSQRALGAYYDETRGCWQPPSQGSEVLFEVGASSKDIRLRTKCVV